MMHQTFSSTPVGDGYMQATGHFVLCPLTTPSRWNHSVRLAERRTISDVAGLTELAAAAVSRNVEDVLRLEKLVEGGFNRTFLLTMLDDFQLIARIPYPMTEPKHLLVTSEAATIDFLKLHEKLVPKIYGYSPTADSAAGVEYILTGHIKGTSLAEIWNNLDKNATEKVISNLVELESRLLNLKFSASGSLYYTHDLAAGQEGIDMSSSFS